MYTSHEFERTRRILGIITAAIFGGGYLIGLIALVYLFGGLLEGLGS